MRVLTTTPLLLSPQVCERRWGRAFARLSAEAPDGRLEALELSDTQPGVEPLQAVQLAAAAPAQRALRRRVLAALADAAPPPGLASVAMRGVGLGDAERQLLLRLVRHHPRLATLDIRHNALSPPAVEELGRLVSACNRERLAAGIAGDKPFAVIDTENRRALHYADRFRFDHAELRPPFRPDAYADADRNTYTHTDRNTDPDPDTYAHTDRNTYANTDTHTDRNTYAHTDRNTYAYADSHSDRNT
jgi:hypothetical protein